MTHPRGAPPVVASHYVPSTSPSATPTLLASLPALQSSSCPSPLFRFINTFPQQKLHYKEQLYAFPGL